MLPATSTTSHPTWETLRLFGLGMLPAEEREAVERHVEECAECCESLTSMPNDTVLDRLRAGTTATYLPNEAPPSVSVAISPAGIPPELNDHPRYRIVRQLGAGGMGVVYQAEHRLMERPVALKVISRSLVGNSQAIRRFQLEVKAAAKLSHANIVAAFDAEQAGDLHFLVMEYVEGISLSRQVEKRGPLPVHYACGFARQVALGLQHAFEKGMVHRDIKPQNLMVTKAGRVKILDFGLARLAREQGELEPVAAEGLLPSSPQPLAGHAGLTAAGATLGTPDYIAPEQIADSRSADIRSDIYSLGCSLYFLLVGHPPYPVGTAVDKLIAHRRGCPKPIRDLRPEIPVEVAAVVEKMMSKSPADRYATPSEVAQALAPFARPAPASTIVENRTPLAVVTADVDPLGPAPAALDFETLVSLANTAGPMPHTGMQPASRPNAMESLRAQVVSLGKNRTTQWGLGAIGALVTVAMCVTWLVLGSTNDPSTSPSTNPDWPKQTWSSPAPSQGQASGDRRGPTNTGSTNANAGNSMAQTNRIAQPEGASSAASLPMASGPALPPPRVLIVIPHQNLYYPDLGEVETALRRIVPSCRITIASSRREPAAPDPQGRSQNTPIPVDVDLKDARAADFDAVVFTGANPLPNMEFLAGGSAFDATRQFLADARREGCVVAALCGGIAVLADAGELRGQDAAYNKFVVDAVRADHGVTNWDAQRRVVVNGQTVTATDAGDAPRFVQELLRVASARYLK
ncbi:MAG: protein kinase [Pirellulales bacterium]